MNPSAISMFQGHSANEESRYGPLIHQGTRVNTVRFNSVRSDQTHSDIKPGILFKKSQLQMEKNHLTHTTNHLNQEISQSPTKIDTQALDYQPPTFRIANTKLEFEINHENIRVVSCLTIIKERNCDALILDGINLKMNSIRIDNMTLPKDHYRVDQNRLQVYKLPDKSFFKLKIETTTLEPKKNDSRSGIFNLQGIFCTQCAPKGFSRITYYSERPDILSEFSVKMIAEEKQFPILLANGKQTSEGILPDGKKHFVEFHDPCLKPSHQFAFLAGDFGSKKEIFITKNNRQINVRFYTQKGTEHLTAYAWSVLREVMRWDEKHYGQEYDLPTLSLVAIDHFPGGSSNKSLLLFDSRKLLADPATATDEEYLEIEAAIVYEYFSAFVGDRIKIRDWLQLPLREGIRDFFFQEFMMSRHSSFVQRVKDARELKNMEFNRTGVKGAEILRMLRLLIGPDIFHKGMCHYFATCHDNLSTIHGFMEIMKAFSGQDLSGVSHWFSQNTMPEIAVSLDYNEKNKETRLHISQDNPQLRSDEKNNCLFFPFRVGLLDSQGKSLSATHNITIRHRQTTVDFGDIPSTPVPSLLRTFSAPVKLQFNYSPQELALLFVHDHDLFNRYQSGQRLITFCLETLAERIKIKGNVTLPQYIFDAFSHVLQDSSTGLSFRTLALTLPGPDALFQKMNPIDFEIAFEAHTKLTELLANHLEKEFLRIQEELYTNLPYTTNHALMASRSLRNLCLTYLASFKDLRHFGLLKKSYDSASNMTERLQALKLLCHIDSNKEDLLQVRSQVLQDFYDTWKGTPSLINAWFRVQASAPSRYFLPSIFQLEHHPSFDKTNPNHLHSIYKIFTQNPQCFHDETGVGYRFITDGILAIDPVFPHISAELFSAFKIYAKLQDPQKANMREQLLRINGSNILSQQADIIITNNQTESVS
jgi:aminopeptidase N